MMLLRTVKPFGVRAWWMGVSHCIGLIFRSKGLSSLAVISCFPSLQLISTWLPSGRTISSPCTEMSDHDPLRFFLELFQVIFCNSSSNSHQQTAIKTNPDKQHNYAFLMILAVVLLNNFFFIHQYL